MQYKSYSLVFLFLMSFLCLNAQIHLENKVYHPFETIQPTVQQKVDLAKYLKDYTLLKPNTKIISGIADAKFKGIKIELPFEGGMNVELKENQVLGSNFQTGTISEKGKLPFTYKAGAYYKGSIAGKKSIAALSFFEKEVMGVLADEGGNIVLGKWKGNDNLFIMYRESDLLVKPEMSCGASEIPVVPNNLPPNNYGLTTPPMAGTPVGCPIDVYVECDFALYGFNGSNTINTLNYATSLFNNVSTLYDNESIILQLGQVYVHTISDPFVSFSTTSTMLNAWSAYMDTTTYAGDLAHLLSGRSVGGGIAWVDVLCSSNYYKCGLSCNLDNFGNVPAYSWEANEVTHEIGHNLGSKHTQWCGWPGGAIDDCYTTEGGCPPGPSPVNGGTIMSYCHLTANGVNFANGFGPLPGNKVRYGVANAMCACSNNCGLTVIVNSTDANCGAADGSLSAIPNGGTYPYHYLWNTGDTVATLLNAPMGSYTIIITDSSGCVIGDNVEVNVNSGTKIETDCSATLTDGSAANEYVNNINCSWLIQPLGASSITLTFSMFDTEQDYDYVYIYDGTNTATPLLGQYSGNTLPPVLTSSSGAMLIVFTSDIFVTGQGWSATYTTHTNAIQNVSICAGQSYNYNGNVYTTSGTYIDNVNSTPGCDSTVTTVLTVLSPLTTTISQSNVICNGGNTGMATVSAAGSAGGYSYSWNNGQTNAMAMGLTAGNYTVLVTDALGCTNADSVTITQPNAIVITNTQNYITCFGGNNGSITANATGGTGNLSYSWNTGQTGTTISGLTSGTYMVFVSDQNNCQIAQAITLMDPTAISATVSQNNVTCNGGNNGMATVSGSGGTGALTYTWNNGQIGTMIMGLTAGNYSVLITDVNNCTHTENVTIIEPNAISATISQNNVTCNGGNNGMATVNASGGTGGLNYSWSNGQTSAMAMGLTAGTYSVVITDANNCTHTENVTITEPTAISATISQNNVSCNGGNNGMATVTAAGGTGALNYSWSNGQTGTMAMGLSAGTYSVVITDANNCTHTENVTITEPNPISATFTQNNVSCNGGNNGMATVTATGGTGGLTYSWSNGQTSAMAMGLTAGIYSVQITDANNCTHTENITITEPTAISVTISQNNVSCTGGNNGMATATASGGTGALTYSWSNGQTGAMAMGLTAGTYLVVITDANNCTHTENIIITEPTFISVNISHNNVTCNGGNDGMATATASGGTPGYNYSWSNGQTSAMAMGLTAGMYTVVITDANNCIRTQTIMITEPPAITATTTQTDATCNGNSDGTATVVGTGGTGTLMYSWSNGQTGATINNLSAGTYTVTVIDLNGCTTTQSITINAPAPLVATVSSTSINCTNGTNGSATATVSGGTPNYTYSWSTGEITSTIFNLAPGNYTVYVSDSNNCTQSASVLLNNPEPLSSTQNVELCNGDSLVVGTSVYYQAGTYTDMLVSTDGCDSTVTSNITLCVGIEDQLIGQVSVYPNPTSHNLFVNIEGADRGEWNFDLYNALGQSIIHHSIKIDTQTYQHQFDLSQLAAGVYFFRVKDHQGQSKTWRVQKI